MSAVGILVALASAVLALASAVVALSGLGPLRRLWSLAPSPAGSLRPGSAELQGALEAAASTLQSYGGTACVVLSQRVTLYQRFGSKRGVAGTWERTRSVQARLRDSSGACPLRLDLLLLHCPSEHYELEGTEVGPELLALFPGLAQARSSLFEVHLDEQLVAAGSTVVALGEAAETVDPTGEAGYRSAPRAVVLGGTRRRPLLLSVGTEAEARRFLVRPALGLGLLSLASAVLAAAALLLPAYVTAQSGL